MAKLCCVGIFLLVVLGVQASSIVRRTRQIPGYPLASQQVLLPLGNFNVIQPDYLTSGKFSVRDQSNLDIFTGESYGVMQASTTVTMGPVVTTTSVTARTSSTLSTSSIATAATCAPAPTSCPNNGGCTQRVVVQGPDGSGCPLYGCAIDMCPPFP